MDSIFSFLLSNGTLVITVLLICIILCIFFLLLMSSHNSPGIIAAEMNSSAIETALKRVLVDSSSLQGTDVSSKKIQKLEFEIESKQKQIELLEAVQAPGDVEAELKTLQDRLSEYEIIGDDIADLSKIREENTELKKRLSHLSGLKEEETISMPWDEFEQIIAKYNQETPS